MALSIEDFNRMKADTNKGQYNRHGEPEHDMQVSCVKWFRSQYKPLSQLLFAVPNGSLRNKVIARKLKAEGVISGVADLMLAVPGENSHGLFIEMKNGKANNQSSAQKEWEKQITAQGYKYALCRSLEDFIELINKYLRHD